MAISEVAALPTAHPFRQDAGTVQLRGDVFKAPSGEQFKHRNWAIDPDSQLVVYKQL